MKKILYRVKKGDTLLSVCEFFNLSPHNLIIENMLNCEIEEGDLLLINKDETLYEVLPLDTFSSVAKKLNISVDELKRLNPIPYLFYGIKIKIK